METVLTILTVLNIAVFILISFFIFKNFIFTRDPTREIPLGNHVVSPADGKIIEIKEIKNNDVAGIKVQKGLTGKIYTLTKDVAEECYMISVFMNPLDVHVNRAPIEGEIEKISYSKGKFLPVKNVNNGLVNEKNEILINHKKIGKIKVIQIAGFLARRIECWVKEKQKVIKGQRIGRIHLGSQVTIIMPKTVKIRVEKGQKVEAGTTILAEY
jgi:phosphatidylserine decarboxylase